MKALPYKIGFLPCFNRGLIVFALLAFGDVLNAQTSLTVSNFNFETGGFATDSSFSSNPGVVPSGWTATVGGISGTFFGYLNPNNSTYPGTTGANSVAGTMSGPNVFYFGTATTGQGIRQTLSANFDPTLSYTLTVANGARAGGAMASLQMELFAGGNLIGSQEVFNSTAGTFADFSLVVPPSSANNAFAGQPLSIALLEVDDRPGGTEVDVDNVRLTVIPEPSTFALIALGLGVCGVVVRRRQSKA